MKEYVFKVSLTRELIPIRATRIHTALHKLGMAVEQTRFSRRLKDSDLANGNLSIRLEKVWTIKNNSGKVGVVSSVSTSQNPTKAPTPEIFKED
jgi:hypothetical protein